MNNQQWLQLQQDSILKYSRTITGSLRRSMLNLLKGNPKAQTLARQKFGDRGLYAPAPAEVQRFIVEQYFDIE